MRSGTCTGDQTPRPVPRQHAGRHRLVSRSEILHRFLAEGPERIRPQPGGAVEEKFKSPGKIRRIGLCASRKPGLYRKGSSPVRPFTTVLSGNTRVWHMAQESMPTSSFPLVRITYR